MLIQKKNHITEHILERKTNTELSHKILYLLQRPVDTTSKTNPFPSLCTRNYSIVPRAVCQTMSCKVQTKLPSLIIYQTFKL